MELFAMISWNLLLFVTNIMMKLTNSQNLRQNDPTKTLCYLNLTNNGQNKRTLI